MDQNLVQSWGPEKWLAFLVMLAAKADQVVHPREMRLMRRRFDEITLQEVGDLVDQNGLEQCLSLLNDSMPKFLENRSERERLQVLLKDIFLADGEYGEEERKLTQRISAWLA